MDGRSIRDVKVEPEQPREVHGEPTAAEQDAAELLSVGEGTRIRRRRRMWRALPSAPRCKMCTGPFGGPGGAVRRMVGLGPWPANPKYCSGCFKTLYTKRQGAEIECSLLFADIRGSTGLAEGMAARDYRSLLDRFYVTAMAVLVDHEAIVDKFVGDEVIGIFVPVLTGGEHARQAVDAGLELLRATGHGTDAPPWIPIGIGVNTGIAYVGAVGTADHVEFTALGDNVNATSRLASAASAGELLVSDSTVAAVGLDVASAEHRQLELRGKSEPFGVVVLRA